MKYAQRQSAARMTCIVIYYIKQCNQRDHKDPAFFAFFFFFYKFLSLAALALHGRAELSQDSLVSEECM